MCQAVKGPVFRGKPTTMLLTFSRLEISKFGFVPNLPASVKYVNESVRQCNGPDLRATCRCTKRIFGGRLLSMWGEI